MTTTQDIGSKDLLNLKWPENPAVIGLTRDEIKVLEAAISIFHKRILNEKGEEGVQGHILTEYSYVIEKKFAVTVEGEPLRRTTCRVVVYAKKIFVHLNNKNVPKGLSRRDEKFVYNPLSSEMFTKKRILSIEQLSLIRFIASQDQKESGFSEIGHIEERKGKFIYFEKYYPMTLTEYSKALMEGVSVNQVGLNTVMKMQNSLKQLHETTYNPPSFSGPTGKFQVFRRPSFCFHGDISPDNCVVEISKEGTLILRLNNQRFFTNAKTISSLEGWEPPEGVDEGGPPENQDYGIKKDSWQFALLVGTVIRGGVFFHPITKHPLPRFSFILNKLKVVDGKLDRSGLKKITQKEINEKILSLINETEYLSVKHLWSVIGKWLTVDPIRRPSISEVFLR